MYKLTFKNYILVTLAIIASLLLLCECDNIKILIITKIVSFVYLLLFGTANIKQAK